MEEMIKLTNGKKTIIRSKIQYEANVAHFKMRGFTPLDEVKKEIKKATLKDIADKVGQLGVQAIKEAGISFGLNCPLDAEYNIGNNWSETH